MKPTEILQQFVDYQVNLRLQAKENERIIDFLGEFDYLASSVGEILIEVFKIKPKPLIGRVKKIDSVELLKELKIFLEKLNNYLIEQDVGEYCLLIKPMIRHIEKEIKGASS